MTGTPEYRTWNNIKNRCLNANNDRFDDYGGRGIMICDRWLNSFENFYEDMGPRPSDKHSIERKNNYGNYEPSNCIWALPTVQNRNTRRVKLYTYKGQTKMLCDWIDELGLDRNTVYYRLFTAKRLYGTEWSVEDAFEIPVEHKYGKPGNQNARKKI
jgi:hypothetical protein